MTDLTDVKVTIPSTDPLPPTKDEQYITEVKYYKLQKDKNSLPNYFLLSTFNSKNVLSLIIYYCLAEFIMSSLLTFVPTVLGLMWTGYDTSSIDLTTMKMMKPKADPMVSLIIALATSSVIFVGYLIVPGATGNPFFVIEQFALEFMCEYKDPLKQNKWFSTFLYFSKMVLAVVSIFCGALVGVKLAQFAVPDAMPEFVSPLSEAIDTDAGRIILLEFLAFTFYWLAFNRLYRVSPHNHAPLGRSSNVCMDVLQLSGLNFVLVLILYGLTGSTLNCVRSWATATVVSDKTAFAYFVGQLLGAMFGLAAAILCYHMPRYLYTAVELESKHFENERAKVYMELKAAKEAEEKEKEKALKGGKSNGAKDDQAEVSGRVYKMSSRF